MLAQTLYHKVMGRTRCDDEGVPKVIQFMEYHPSPMHMEFLLFNGRVVPMAIEVFEMPGVDLGTISFTSYEMEVIERKMVTMIEKYPEGFLDVWIPTPKEEA